MNFALKVYSESLLVKKKMPKSVSTVQNQISGCERSIQDLSRECYVMFGNTNFQFNFDFNNFMRDVTTVNLDDTASSIEKVQQMFQECQKIIVLEKKRRKYTEELHKIVAKRERRETVKRLCFRSKLKKTTLVNIPSQSSQE